MVGEGRLTVDPDGTSLEGVANTDGSSQVLGVNGRGQAVGAIVCELDGLGLILKLGDGTDRAEDLLLHDLHIGFDIAKDSGLDEITLVTVALTTDLDCRTFVLAGLDVTHDAVILKLADLRALEGLLMERITDNVLASTGLESLDKLVVDALLHVDARSGAAALAVVEVNAEVDPVDGLLDIGVVEHDIRRLTAELESNLLQVGGGGGLHDGTTNERGTGEGDLVNIHMRGDGGAGDLAESRDDVENTGGEASLLDVLGKYQSGQRSLLSRLQDDGVAGGKRRPDLPGKHEKGEVPWDDLAANTKLI